jgi:hypothetical protein|tara:strand:- start:312 stop:545 length:234 start_codon:yes stop_codon:yes gene_type:complete
MDWMNWENFAYLMVIILGALGTMVATKYRMVVKELKEVAKKYSDAKKDGKVTKEEQQAIAKECMDVLMAVVKMLWKF